MNLVLCIFSSPSALSFCEITGAFLIPYCLNIVLTGIPLFFFELAFGQFASQSPVAIWNVVPLFQGEYDDHGSTKKDRKKEGKHETELFSD